jgi:hypothetical protein
MYKYERDGLTDPHHTLIKCTIKYVREIFRTQQEKKTIS